MASGGVDVEDLVGHLAPDGPSQPVAVVLDGHVVLQLGIYAATALLYPCVAAGGPARGVDDIDEFT